MEPAKVLQAATHALQEKQYEQALAILDPFLMADTPNPDFWQLGGLAYKGLNDSANAEALMIRSLELSPKQPHVRTNLGNLYRQVGKPEAAIPQYQEALKMQPQNIPAAINMGRALLDIGELDAAEETFAKVLQLKPGHVNALVGIGQVLQQKGLQEQSMGLFRQALEQDPNNVAALNGLGLALKTLGYPDDAVDTFLQAARQAPESKDVQVNLASAMAQAGREEEAIAAYQRALAQDLYNPEVHQWLNGYLGVMGHEDYLASYREALQSRPGEPALATAWARKLLLNHRNEEALAVLDEAISHQPDAPKLYVERSHVLRESEQFDAAVEAARKAVALDPEDASNQAELATAIMAAAHDYQEAADILAALVPQYPNDQSLWALYVTALRYAQREEEYARLADYERLVNVRAIEAPAGYARPEHFVEDLRETLLQLHNTRQHPVEQSMVNGTQTLDDLLSRKHPHVQALTDALREQLIDIASTFPQDETHPLLSRNTGDVDFSDSWSVRLTRDGFHKNHFHSQGWLSSAFYVAVPDIVNSGTGAGWIKFGEPGFKAREPLAAEYWVKPVEGTLAVFPSYMWHGVEPIAGDDVERMTVGYDVLPRKGR
jgi:tetratricopeptide (TPR) repeat protein